MIEFGEKEQVEQVFACLPIDEIRLSVRDESDRHIGVIESFNGLFEFYRARPAIVSGDDYIKIGNKLNELNGVNND